MSGNRMRLMAAAAAAVTSLAITSATVRAADEPTTQELLEQIKQLQAKVEKLEAKYEAQVRRTEEIQLNSQHQLIELQRMTAIGQSETLGNFMLKAREWWQGNEPEKRETEAPTG